MTTKVGAYVGIVIGKMLMKKRQNKLQKCKDLGNAVMQIRNGEKVRRIGAKDGSIPTHPVVRIDYPGPEKRVLGDCLYWLKKHHVMHNRHDCGGGDFGAGYVTYGILGSGDIHGVLRHHDGKHFEIECKRGKGGTLSKAQQKRMKQVRDNGGLYFVVHGVEELEFLMGEWA